MKNYILKWLGLNDLALNTKIRINNLEAENASLRKELDELTEKVNEMEEPDMSDYITESDINDRIETYCNDYDIPNKDWIEGEIEDKVQEAIDNAGIEEQVRDLFNDASPSPMSEADIKKEVQEQVKITLERVIKALADGGK